MKYSLSVVICSINPDNCIRLLNSLKRYITNQEIIIIIDGRKYLNNTQFFDLCNTMRVRLHINYKNKGLSYSRNLAMNLCVNDYILFLDDDVLVVDNVLKEFEKKFIKGYKIGGAKLSFPPKYKNKGKWLPKGYSYLFGVHSNENKIWGACFGFQISVAKENGIFFQDNLGRKGKQLQSGDDTLFVKQYIDVVKNSFFLDIVLYHYFSEKRFKLSYILKRIYWQGRSERRRNNFIKGIKKEWMRSSLDNNSLIKFLLGKLLMIIFFVGYVVEILSEWRYK